MPYAPNYVSNSLIPLRVVVLNDKLGLAKANLGDVEGQWQVGTCFARGWGGVPKDAEAALKWYELAVSGGYRSGAFSIAYLLLHEDALVSRRREAVGWLQQSSIGVGIWTLALIYEKGEIVPRDLSAALHCWEQALSHPGHGDWVEKKVQSLRLAIAAETPHTTAQLCQSAAAKEPGRLNADGGSD